MTDYERLRHMTRAPATTTGESAAIYYLPHHGVLKEASSTTKLRVVFNGSAVTNSGTTLNDHLFVGPNLLPALSDVVLRWRWHRYVFTADIEKMYCQILVHPEDRDLQRIVWRRPGQLEVGEFRLNTVTYGLACAPFLAMRTLKQLAVEEAARFPLGAAILRGDVYMDDILTGAATLPGALDIQAQLLNICRAGGFPLQKWAANHAALLEPISGGDCLEGEAVSIDAQAVP